MIFFKTVTLNNTLYLRQEDVVEMIREMAGSEETDVRTRFNKMAENIAALKPKP